MVIKSDYSDEQLRCAAKERVARIFHVESDSLTPNVVFGEGLKESFVSDWKDNEFDEIHFDIDFVANRHILKEIESGDLVIRTVGDYCEHMVRCYRFKPKRVIRILFK